MSFAAIDFAGMLAEARREARERREQQQRETQQQRNLRVNYKQEDINKQREQEQLQQWQETTSEQQEQPQRLQEAQQEKQQPHAESSNTNRVPAERRITELLPHDRQGEQKLSAQQTQLLHRDQRQQGKMLVDVRQQQLEEQKEKKVEANSPKVYREVLQLISLHSVDLREVYNGLQQHRVGLGKPTLLVDLRSSSLFSSKHIAQAISAYELLQRGPLLQRLQHQPSQKIIVYGASCEEDEIFRQLELDMKTANITYFQRSGEDAAFSLHASKKAICSTLLRVLKVLLQRFSPLYAVAVQQEPHSQQRREEQQGGQRQHEGESHAVGRSCGGRYAMFEQEKWRSGGEERFAVGWLHGGLATFATAFPFLCVSERIEEEATSSLTATNSAAFMSYPLLVYRSPLAAQDGSAEATTAAAGGAAAPRAKAGESSSTSLAAGSGADALAVCSSAASRLAVAADAATPAKTAASPSSSSSAVKYAEAAAAAGARGLYVGTALHGTSKAIRQRLGIGLIIDVTSSGFSSKQSSTSSISRSLRGSGVPSIGTSSSRRNTAAPSDSNQSRCGNTAAPSSSNQRDCGNSLSRIDFSSICDGSTLIRSCGGSTYSRELIEEEATQVLRPIMSPEACAAVRQFLDYNDAGDGGRRSFTEFSSCLERMPQRKREVAAAAGRYLLPLSACVRLLKLIFLQPPRAHRTARQPEAAAVRATEVDDAARSATLESSLFEGSTSRRRRSSSVRSGNASSNCCCYCRTGSEITFLPFPGEKSNVFCFPEKAAAHEEGRRSTLLRRKSVLIVHCGDSEAWSGSAAAAIVAGFLFVQQKRVQVVLPQRGLQTAVALLSACWRSAPLLEDSHRQQLQRFCEDERKRCGSKASVAGDSREAGDNGEARDSREADGSKEAGVNREAEEYKRYGKREEQGTPSSSDIRSLWFSAIEQFAAEVSPVTRRQRRSRGGADISSCASRTRAVDRKSLRIRRQYADDAYATAAAALHTINLCRLPRQPVFLLSASEGVDESSLRPSALASVAEKGKRQEEEKKQTIEDSSWPLYLLRHINRMSRKVQRLVAVVTYSDQKNGNDFSFRVDSGIRTSSGSSRGSESSGDEIIAKKDMLGENKRSQDEVPARKYTCQTTDTLTSDLRRKDGCGLFGAEGEAEDVLTSYVTRQYRHQAKTKIVKTRRQHIEAGATQLFARISNEEDKRIQDAAAMTLEPAALISSGRSVETGTTATLRAVRVSSSRLIQFSTNTQRSCAGVAVDLPDAQLFGGTPTAIAESLNVCEEWELAANTMGCIVATSVSVLEKRNISRVCNALTLLLQLLASSCSGMLGLLSTKEGSMEVLARVSTAWGVLLLNFSVLWVRLAPVVRDNVPSLESTIEGRRRGSITSSPDRLSHAVLGETILYTLLRSILQLVTPLLLRLWATREATALSNARRPPSSDEAQSRLRLTSNTSSSHEISTVHAASEGHMVADEVRLGPAEGQEAWLFGYPLLGLKLMLCALHGAFLRPQIVRKLHKKLVAAAARLPRGSHSIDSEAYASFPSSRGAEAPASGISHTAAAEAGAAADVSSIRRIMNSEAVQITLKLAEVWAVIHPENLQQLLHEALHEEEGLCQRDRGEGKLSSESRIPASLSAVLRPIVFAGEEYGKQEE